MVYTFGFSIGLGVVGSGEGEVIVEEASKLLGEGRGELWSSIRDNFVVETKAKVNFIEEEGDNPFCSDSFLNGVENHPLCKPMVDHDQ